MNLEFLGAKAQVGGILKRSSSNRATSSSTARSPEELTRKADSGMPIYEYVCMVCESHFEELVRNGETAVGPDCGAGNVRRQFSVFAAHGTAAQPRFGPARPEADVAAGAVAADSRSNPRSELASFWRLDVRRLHALPAPSGRARRSCSAPATPTPT